MFDAVARGVAEDGVVLCRGYNRGYRRGGAVAAGYSLCGRRELHGEMWGKIQFDIYISVLLFFTT